MLRSFLITLSKAVWIEKIIVNWRFAWNAASRFIAGTTIDEAFKVVKDLNEKGINVTLDQLGEHTSTPDEANQAAGGIVTLLDAIQTANVRANVSIKLTQIGMGMDETTCRANLSKILERAKLHGNFIRVDIEDTPWTDITYNLYAEMMKNNLTPRQFGMAAQAYLYRAEKDVREMIKTGTHFRIVKGAYNEPVTVAFPNKKDVDKNYDLLITILLDASLVQKTILSADGRIPPLAAIATHDEARIKFAKAYAEKIALPKDGMEFQMLYGIRRDLQEALVKEGYPVRVYVPFGKSWYPYFMRRLAERPANIWFFISNYFRK
jgi:proline dehydrogenase